MLDGSVSLVIPGKNCSRTIRPCLEAVIPMLSRPDCRLGEIIFVDDGSTDDTVKIVAEFPVRYLKGPTGGPGAARNVGWRAAIGELIWFIDSDCIAEPDTLVILLQQFDSPQVGGVSGGYSNVCKHSLLACLIHEEIAARHATMRREVNFLGGFNVVYPKHVLEQVGGFDETFFNGPGSPGAEDAELSYRVHAAGYVLRFDGASRVGHHHPTRLLRYLRAQRHHGYWRVNLHLWYSAKSKGDAYSNIIDHCQPPLAMLALCMATLCLWPGGCLAAIAPLVLLALAQLPMTVKLLRRTGEARMIWFAPLGFMRAFARGFGMIHGMWDYFFGRTAKLR